MAGGERVLGGGYTTVLGKNSGYEITAPPSKSWSCGCRIFWSCGCRILGLVAPRILLAWLSEFCWCGYRI